MRVMAASPGRHVSEDVGANDADPHRRTSLIVTSELVGISLTNS